MQSMEMLSGQKPGRQTLFVEPDLCPGALGQRQECSHAADRAPTTVRGHADRTYDVEAGKHLARLMGFS